MTRTPGSRRPYASTRAGRRASPRTAPSLRGAVLKAAVAAKIVVRSPNVVWCVFVEETGVDFKLPIIVVDAAAGFGGGVAADGAAAHYQPHPLGDIDAAAV